MPKGDDYFVKHLDADTGDAMLGVIIGGTLISQCAIVHPSDANPDTGMVDMAPCAAPEQVSVLQAVSTAPAFRGHHLMEKMARQWMLHAQNLGRTHLLAEIDTRNSASWGTLVKCGLNIVSIGTDPDDGTKVYNAHEQTVRALAKSLTPVFNRYAELPSVECPYSDTGVQQNLMTRGYTVTGYRKEASMMILKKMPL